MTADIEDVVRMHHRRLPVGSTATIEARLATVLAEQASVDDERSRMEAHMSTMAIESSSDLFDQYRLVIARQREVTRARRVLEGELRRRSAGDGTA